MKRDIKVMSDFTHMSFLADDMERIVDAISTEKDIEQKRQYKSLYKEVYKKFEPLATAHSARYLRNVVDSILKSNKLLRYVDLISSRIIGSCEKTYTVNSIDGKRYSFIERSSILLPLDRVTSLAMNSEKPILIFRK